MTDEPIDLDEHHGMTAQKATEIRRRLQEVQLDQAALRARQAEFEQFLLAAPAMTWPEVAEKARYLFQLYAATADAEAPRAEYAVGKDLNKSLHVPGNPAVLEQSESIFNRDIPWLVFHFAPLQGCSAKLPRGGKPVRYPP